MFTEPEREARGFPLVATVLAAVLVVFAVAFLWVVGRRHPDPAHTGTGGAAASYTSQLLLSGIQMSESTSFSGGKETFVDGRISNRGSSTVVSATVQVIFPADGGVSPQAETVPVMLIRTRQPYIDTEPLSAEPLASGASAEFRLTFDDIRPDWNQGTPVIRVIAVSLK